MKPPSKGKRHVGKSILAGGIAGALEICCTYPTEYVKTQLHLQKNLASNAVRFSGPVDCACWTVQNQGFFALYRGLSPLLYFSVPKVASRFAAYNLMRNAIVDDTGKMTPLQSLLCGLGAGACEAVVVVTPMETLKVKFINDQNSGKPRFKSFFHGTRMLIQEQGIRSCYQGLAATILRQGTNQAMRFFVYNSLRERLKASDPNKELAVWQTLICGGVAGAVSVFGNTPIDVIKTRMQGLDARRLYTGYWDCVKTTWAEGGGSITGGVRSFYKGTTPRLVRVVLDVALVFTLYEQVRCHCVFLVASLLLRLLLPPSTSSSPIASLYSISFTPPR
eukprot:m.142386 g.142386  ORF g.142386 m.142386 type:complete len:334 (-) comp24183_c0_seq7:109-1110(-)